MIPLKDINPREKFPFFTYLIILLNVFIFLFEISKGSGIEEFFRYFGLIPKKFVYFFFSEPLNINIYIPFITSIFLHGGLLHLLGNMISLWIFGDNVEDKMGHFVFIFFYFFSGFFASFIHILFNFYSSVPTIGASGAIAGVMGSYFYFFPRARVLTILPLFFFFQIVEIPAFVFLGLWFLIQFFSGVLSLGIPSAGGIAWWAHIGGFLFGYIFSAVFFKRKRRIIYYL